jgi:hypothetical protein
MQNVSAKQNFQNMAFVTDSIADMTEGKCVNEKVEKSGGIGRVFLL